jgi:hypothetical protein
VARSSSAHKISRLAQKGKGKKVRFQGGSVFPTVVLAVVILGSMLVAYARQAAPPVDASVTADQEYALSFGVYYCDTFVTGFPVGPDDLANLDTDEPAYIAGDGLVLWKPQILAGERKAKLGTIFELYGLTVTDTEITFPAAVNGGETITEADTTCGGEPATVSVVSWKDAFNDADSKVSIASFDGVRLTDDNMAIVLAFTASGTDVPQPDSVELLSTITRQG